MILSCVKRATLNTTRCFNNFIVVFLNVDIPDNFDSSIDPVINGGHVLFVYKNMLCLCY